MPIYARAVSDFKPVPAGQYAAVCCDVVDLGELAVTYNKVTTKKHFIRIVWQIEGERDDGKPLTRDDGKPFTVGKRYTLSLHEKSNLRKDLEAWRSRTFTEPELNGFDLENLLSIPALVNVIHEPKEGTVYANVASIMRLPKAMTAPTVRDYVRVCDREPQSQICQPDEVRISDDDIPF